MNTLGITRLGAVALLCCSHLTSAMAITFTHDAFISFADVSNEGQDIVVTNCTLTVDGPHTFNSLQLLNGGVLTHSALPYGPQQISLSVSGEAHVMSATNAATLNNTNVDTSTIAVMNTSATIFYTENVDYIVAVSNQFIQLTLTTNSAIAEGATVLVDYDWAQNFQGFTLTINNDAKVATGGAINVSGKGYAGGIGANNGAGTSRATNSPFVFTAGGGAGHGGAGGMSSTFARGGATYDSTTNPAALGCGGGTGSADGGAGGGVVSLSVGGDFQVDGQILAGGFRGTNAHSGGGAGGSILISANGLSGAGTISANGGSGDTPDGGGGGGGRIAIYSHTNSFSGNLTAFGGGGANVGGAGTIYLKSGTNFFGQLFIVNAGKRGTNTTFSGDMGDLTVSGGAILQAPILPLSVANLYVGSNSVLASLDSLPLSVTVAGNATVDSTAMINADFKSSTGPGAGIAVGSCFSGAGGSYGGFGGMSVCGARGGLVYGSISQPSNLGSPGTSGARAGGAIKMTVGGTLSLSGTISANGDSAIAASSGGGSGGSVWLTVGTLSGAGAIAANGGSTSNLVSGGGGGGRVAIYFNTNLFSGNITAHGGAGTNSGGAGSVYLKSSSDPFPQIIFHNGGLAGNTTLIDTLAPSDLTISGGAVLTNSFQALATIRNLFIGSNSWFTSFPYPTASLSVTVAKNATIQSGGGMIADANSTSSSGAGQSINLIGGGGGDAGNGGLGGTNATGGTMIASHSSPAAGGGTGGAGTGPGGLGGGLINLTVSGTLILDGEISANGGAGLALNSGGGAGGGIRVSAGTLSGTGIISANGGPGNSLGGGGGGGAIAIDSNTNLFLGTTTAAGGGGSQFGGAGTIYKEPFALGGKSAPLTMDNGGHRGAITPLGSTFDVSDLIITGGAVVSNTVVISQVTNVVVGSNSVLQISSGDLTATSITIMSGGSINEDGVNPLDTPGVGQTLNSSGGGGGGAGTGGASAFGAAGGVAVSTIVNQPATPGGRGGGGSGQTLNRGGNGGGSLRITALNTLRLDGRLSADGAPGASLNSGGGAGGSVWISVKTLAGSGVVSANGGAGNFAGGGGGGGHIGISSSTNTFAGTLTARGGGGASFGGAGTVFLGPNPAVPSVVAPQVILDNGGVVGGLTPLFSPLDGNSSLTIKGGAILTNSTASQVRNLFIGSNSTWIFNSSSILAVLTNATIEAGGVLTADGTSAVGQSPGQSGGTRGGGGGGHGGYGGASFSNVLGGNVTSDTITTPQFPGSPGGSGGGFGGGVVRLNVNGTLQLDGRISANGGINSSNLNSGGGSGGSVWLIVHKLAGTGIISANGGAANNLGGGGGGGRVAVWYNTNVFTGPITARGGPGANFGGAGTVFLNHNVDLGGSSQLLIDNGGARGTNTLLTANVTGDVIITNGASATLATVGFAPIWNSLTISSNSSLSGISNSPIQFTLNNNLDVQAGGALMLDGQGYGANAGPGAGFAISGGGGGAGHGGLGSTAANATNGGVSYDSITSPSSTGSGGGSPSATSGSAGGGAAFLTVKGICTINGVISANGTAGIVGGAGGGSGGSLRLVAGTISGAGKISADGGNGDVFTSGGGAGGRIALYFGSNFFSGTISAHGGAGVGLAGGAGTIYFKTNSSAVAQLIVDNGGLAGTTTPLSAPNPQLQVPVSLSIRNRGKVDSTTPLTLQGLSIAADSGIISHSLVPLNITVLGNALVDTNAIFTADAAGYNVGAGPGTGNVDFAGNGSGGGYGGMGGASFYGAPGGSTYGSSNQPVDLGSPGRMTPVLMGFSQGGGAIRLTVNGALTVNGNISADGADGFIDGSGGGSGGSIWVSAQTLLGNGSFTANGGQGESFEGGGGGGGRIAIYVPTNLFAGTISAMGGDGASPGQDGTIYVPTSFLISGVVTNLNGKGVPGITLQPTGLLSQTTDTNGFYSVSVPLYWSGSIVPSGNGVIFPDSRTYLSVSQDTPGQNFLLNSTSTLIITGAPFVDNSYFTVNWFALNGVNYQVQYSTNLVDWVPVGPVYIGNDAPREIVVPTGNAAQMYFRINTY